MRVAAHCNISSNGLNQYELLHRLASLPHNTFPYDLRKLFHELRQEGNDAVHDLTTSHGEALHQLKMARQLAIWFHRTFNQPKNFNPGPFIPPPDPAKESRALAAELERLRRALDTAQLDSEAARAAADAEARRRLDAEERARRDAEERAIWQQLAEEAEKRLAAELAALQARAAAQPPEALKQLAAASAQATEKLELDEADTRRLIDAQLREAGWEADSERLTHEGGARPEPGRNQAIAEWPTSEGRADYVLFVGLRAVAVVEAKRWRTDVPGVLPQARRYAEALSIPFLFASNARPYLKQLETKSGIWFHDMRRPQQPPPCSRWLVLAPGPPGAAEAGHRSGREAVARAARGSALPAAARLPKAKKLDAAIFDRAFRGELVPQDPNDEPASVLLERIRAEREATAGSAPKRSRGRSSAA